MSRIPSPAIAIGLSFACTVWLAAAFPGRAQAPPSRQPKLFDGTSRILLVHGYSTSYRWPEVLQRKLDRYFEDSSPLQVRTATAGGTPIAKWIDLKTGQPQQPWIKVLRPKLQEAGQTPVVLLAQQSLQWVFGPRQAGIRGPEDRERIQQGADALESYAHALRREGADLIFIAMHIYKHPMEPEIGNERLALDAFLKRNPEGVFVGPDVWSPTKEVYPWGYARDRLHPGEAAVEIMAQHWFVTLLDHDGLPAPDWSRREMTQALERAGP